MCSSDLLLTARLPSALAEQIRTALKDAMDQAGGAAIPMSSFLSMLLTRGLDSLEASTRRRSGHRREQRTEDLSPKDQEKILTLPRRD